MNQIMKEIIPQNFQVRLTQCETYYVPTLMYCNVVTPVTDALEREDEDELEEQRIAKRFTKRARMNRVLEQHGSDQVSQPCITEQDEHSMLDLKSIKVRVKQVYKCSSFKIPAC